MVREPCSRACPCCCVGCVCVCVGRGAQHAHPLRVERVRCCPRGQFGDKQEEELACCNSRCVAFAAQHATAQPVTPHSYLRHRPSARRAATRTAQRAITTTCARVTSIAAEPAVLSSACSAARCKHPPAPTPKQHPIHNLFAAARRACRACGHLLATRSRRAGMAAVELQQQQPLLLGAAPGWHCSCVRPAPATATRPAPAAEAGRSCRQTPRRPPGGRAWAPRACRRCACPSRC